MIRCWLGFHRYQRRYVHVRTPGAPWMEWGWVELRCVRCRRRFSETA